MFPKLYAEFREYVAQRAEANPDEPYVFNDTQNCALAQFGRHKYGDAFVSAGAFAISTRGGPRHPVIPVEKGPGTISHHLISAQTWGELNARLA